VKRISTIIQRPAGRVFLRALVTAAVVAFVGLSACETSPPVQEMSDARQAIAVARKAGAADHAKLHLRAAENYLQSAERSLDKRSYHQARRDAKQAKMKALDALHASELQSVDQ
jgi:hypothetical protein